MPILASSEIVAKHWEFRLSCLLEGVHEQRGLLMSLIARSLSVGFSAVAACMLWLGAAFAEPGGCSLDRSGSQDVVRCPDGLTIIVEKGARYSLADRNGDGQVDGARLARQGAAARPAQAREADPLRGHHAAGHRGGARHPMGGRRPERQDLGLRRQGPRRGAPSRELGRRRASAPAKASMSRRAAARWSSSTGRPSAWRP